jgi:hypothetical protein
MTEPLDITGHRYGRLVAIYAITTQQWMFKCDCGQHWITTKNRVRTGNTKSCGCLKLDHGRLVTHGQSRKGKASPTYITWINMKSRCATHRHSMSKYYADRGIKICKRWLHSFENFLADMGEKPPGLTLERINNGIGYRPSNCKWATRSDQSRNTRYTKLTREKAGLIRKDRRSGPAIARDYGISLTLVHKVKAGEIWR